jgi:hypothetical protein
MPRESLIVTRGVLTLSARAPKVFFVHPGERRLVQMTVPAASSVSLT